MNIMDLIFDATDEVDREMKRLMALGATKEEATELLTDEVIALMGKDWQVA